jgi:hypothetical protein
MSKIARPHKLVAPVAQAIKSTPRLITLSAGLLLILGAVGAYAATHRAQSAHAKQSVAITNAHPSPSPSPTASPAATPVATSTPAAPKPLPPAAAKSVLASVSNIKIPTQPAPISTPSPDNSPGVISPDVAAWYTAWGSNFDAVSDSFTVLGQAADANDLNQISLACGGFVSSAQHGLLAPAIPDSALDQRYRNSLTQLSQGGVQCVHGIQSGDADMAISGLNLLETAGIALVQLQAEIAPSN